MTNPIKSLSTVYGYPRIGRNRELKKATEKFWKGDIDAAQLKEIGSTLRKQVWTDLQTAGIDLIPSNTFSFYDQMADAVALFGAIPDKHKREDELSTYFAMARGDKSAPPLEMTKWFDTNYHYLVPQIGPDTQFSLSGTKPIDEYKEARSLGIETRPVIPGPFTFLYLAKTPADFDDDNFVPLDRLDDLVDVYLQLLQSLATEEVSWVQLDEPALVYDLSQDELARFKSAYGRIVASTSRPKLMVATYFGPLRDSLEVLRQLNLDAVGIDLSARGDENYSALLKAGEFGKTALVAGIVDGRNVWINNMDKSFERLKQLKEKYSELIVSSSCSLMHVPVDVSIENEINEEVRAWLAFADQKVAEIAVLSAAINGDPTSQNAMNANAAARQSREASKFVVNPSVRKRVETISESDDRRQSTYEKRREIQQQKLNLPLLPTTTIGSFPQTSKIRRARAAFGKGELTDGQYEEVLKDEVRHVVKLQEEIGIDVLVHGEPERNDMVQYFGEQLEGCVFTKRGWVQSYGSRYVRPPIIAGDVSRPAPMSVSWSQFAQSLTDKPMKGMLTGPVTMLCWSFVRDDISWRDTVTQMALALRDEVSDLEAAGITTIQVDEPALREGLPLRQSLQSDYLDAATRAFRLSTSSVQDATQIHTHMCYAEFGEIVDSVRALDADVISLEATRSHMTIADELLQGNYKAGVGPGVYDIHSPRVPSKEEIVELLDRAVNTLDPTQLWSNPDCGLKTRAETEVVASLKNMVDATLAVRKRLG